MKLLRKKKLLEREHEKKEGTIEHLNSVLTQIEQTDCSSLVNTQFRLFSLKTIDSISIKVINAYSSGVQAHKELLRKNGLTPDAVDDMIDEVQEVKQYILRRFLCIARILTYTTMHELISSIKSVFV